MSDVLDAAIAAELAAAVPTPVADAAARLADMLGGVAVLFYGSVLRTGALGDIVDFYVLTDRARGAPLRRLATRWLWPDVSYHELRVGDALIRAKVAALPLATFERAASGAALDTTIWVRFAQPAALVFAASAADRARVVRAVARATAAAAGFAAMLGPRSGAADDYWRALFRATYRTELRVEPPGREAQILAHHPERYRRLLPIAWAAAGIAFDDDGGVLTPRLPRRRARALAAAWSRRALVGKPLNAARLVKAAFTFDGAARYGAWKIERHTGVRIELTPWRERHPILAGPGALWRVLRARTR